jgi:hypothetical protein
MIKQENFYSYHVFFFPFKWEIDLDDMDNDHITKNMNLFQLSLEKNSSRWIRSKDSYFPPKSLSHYNEVSYFYDFVQPTIYDDGKETSFIHHYSIADHGQLYYTIELLNGKTYTLELDDILLHIYGTGVGVLSFHLYNKNVKQSDPEDILNINQFGRRLFPPFFGTDFDKIGDRSFDIDNDWATGLNKVKQSELANKISIGNEKIILAEDDFTHYTNPSEAPQILSQLLTSELVAEMKIIPVDDDRMFVLSWYGNTALSNLIKQYTPQNGYSYISNEWWYRFIFLDSGLKTCQNIEMTNSLLKKHSNARWVDFGTLYGASRYSFVALTDLLSNVPLVASHMRTMYYKMVELCLIQKISLLKFSEEVTDISNQRPERKLVKRVGNLYKRYIYFVNKVYHQEVTGQDQGIELYDLLKGHMRISSHLDKLNNEIQELHEYAVLLEEKSGTEAIKNLTLIGALFLVPTFLVAFFDMHLVKDNVHLGNWNIGIFLLGTFVTTGLLVVAMLTKSWLRWLYLACFIILLCVMVLYVPYLIFN